MESRIVGFWARGCRFFRWGWLGVDEGLFGIAGFFLFCCYRREVFVDGENNGVF